MISAHPRGVVIDVWVVPAASRNEVGGVSHDALRVRTTAPAEGGKANRAVAKLVASAVGAKRGEVLSGSRSRRKKVLVEGVNPEEVRDRLPHVPRG